MNSVDTAFPTLIAASASNQLTFCGIVVVVALEGTLIREFTCI